MELLLTLKREVLIEITSQRQSFTGNFLKVLYHKNQSDQCSILFLLFLFPHFPECPGKTSNQMQHYDGKNDIGNCKI
jgi:hypothetical protein